MALATRDAYRDCLMSLLPQNPDAICLDTDTGLFKPEHVADAGDQYLNLGIAEHTLMGIAAGMAACGRKPYVNTMAAFAASRALESIKINIAYNGLPVRIAATHGGLSAGHLGPTHQALEDLAVMRVLPGMTVVVPADATATKAFVAQSINLPGPLYMRLGRKPTPELPSAAPPEIGKAQMLREGDDILLACCGPYPVLACLAAADILTGRGIAATVLNCHTLSPFDSKSLIAAAYSARLVLTVEEHWRVGGLGGAVTEILAEGMPKRVLRIGMSDQFVDEVGGQEHLVGHYGLTAERIVDTACAALNASAMAEAPQKERMF